jgi:putative Mn2+ efflux pump MntP
MLAATSGIEQVSLLTLVVIAFGLSADCFAVAVGSSMAETRAKRWRWARFSISFGIFQALMPILGWLAGRTVVDLISAYDHWIAFGLLAFVGGKMLWESFHEKERDEGEGEKADSLLTLATLSIATSIDAMAVGLSFAFLKINIWAASVTIGAVAFGITGIGFLAGRHAGKLLGHWAEIIGGMVLVGIGLRILISHLLG